MPQSQTARVERQNMTKDRHHPQVEMLQRVLAFLELFGWLMSDDVKRVIGRKNRRGYDLENSRWAEVGGISAQLSRIKYYFSRIFGF